MEQFLFEAPHNISELKRCLRDATGDTYILSGGTDLTIKLRNSGIYSGRLIDMTGIGELGQIKLEDGFVKIGANVTFSEISESKVIEKYAACVGQAASLVGSPQIRNMARMAGNIANSSPRGDSIPALYALDAKIRTVDGDGNEAFRTISEIVTGIGQNSLRKNEAIIEIMIPYSERCRRSAFGKCGRESSRTTVVISNINVAAAIYYDESTDTIEEASVVIGSAAPVPYHAEKAEAVLVGSRPAPEVEKRFVDSLCTHVRESINGVRRYENKIDEVAGIGTDIIERLFCDLMAGGVRK